MGCAQTSYLVSGDVQIVACRGRLQLTPVIRMCLKYVLHHNLRSYFASMIRFDFICDNLLQSGIQLEKVDYRPCLHTGENSRGKLLTKVKHDNAQRKSQS